MSEAITLVLLVLILVGGAIIILALLLAPESLQARIFLPWNAGLFIDTSRPGWRTHRYKGKGQPKVRQSRAWLVAKVWGRSNWEFPLDPGRNIYIGRNRDMDIILKDPAADTRHAVIYRKRDRYHINNLSARKGTRVNGRWITTQRLGNGNKIRMGNTELIFRERR